MLDGLAAGAEASMRDAALLRGGRHHAATTASSKLGGGAGPQGDRFQKCLRARDGRRRPHYHLAMMPWHLSSNRCPSSGFL